jgi:hypothetical protein
VECGSVPSRLTRRLPIGWIAAAVGLIGLGAIGWGDLQALSGVDQRLQAIDQGALPQMRKAHLLALDVDQLRIQVEALIGGQVEGREAQRLAVVAATAKLHEDAIRYEGLAETAIEGRLWKQLEADLASLERQVVAVVRAAPDPAAGLRAAALRDELRRLVWGCDQLVAIGTEQAQLQSQLLQADSRRATRLQLATAGAVAFVLMLLFGWAQLADRRHARQIQEHTRTLERVNVELEAFADAHPG